MIWVCPRCRGDFAVSAAELACRGCGERYPCIGGVPDLRLPGDCWIDMAADREAARELAAREGDLSLPELVRSVFAARSHWDDQRVAQRTRMVLEAVGRLRGELDGWLRPCMTGGAPFLDLGCGPGMLLGAAAAGGRAGVGVDVSLTWLVVAHRLIREYGGTPQLAAGLAEHLPLADGAVSAVVSLDVIEHVADPVPYLREIDRVTAPGGFLALSTPNRYTLGAEPHIGVWGVGWLPRRWQKAYARWRSGDPYEYTRLLSARELGQLLRACTSFACRIDLPAIPDGDIARFPRRRAALARGYNRLRLVPPSSWLFHAVGPFFHISGRKAAGVTVAAARSPAAELRLITSP